MPESFEDYHDVWQDADDVWYREIVLQGTPLQGRSKLYLYATGRSPIAILLTYRAKLITFLKTRSPVQYILKLISRLE